MRLDPEHALWIWEVHGPEGLADSGIALDRGDAWRHAWTARKIAKAKAKAKA